MPNNLVYQSLTEYPVATTNPTYTVYQSIVESARPASQFLHISGALGNNRLDRRVISYKRYASLCNPPQRGRLVLDTSFPRTTINPGEPIVIFEQGTRVLTGYVTKITRSRPSYDWIIDFEDTYTRVTNTFIADNELVFKTATSMKFLIKTILDMTGISYRIGGPDFAVAPGANLSLRTAHDALTEVLAYGGLYAWVDPDGTLRLRRAPGKKFMRDVQNPLSTQEMISTEQTRNRVFIYGGTMTGLPVNSTVIPPQVNIEAHKIIDGLIVDLTTVVANPLITAFADAERMATGMLNEMGSLTDILTFEIEGDPTLRIGTSGSFYHQASDGTITSGSGPITAMETTIDNTGYKMNVTIRERCPRLAGWTQPPNQMRALWIASRCLTADDPRPWKLVWSGDWGLGGQPTYNMVKTIPSGKIMGMQVTRDGSRVYLAMNNTSIPYPGSTSELWYSDNPYTDDVEWVKLSPDPFTGGWAQGVSLVSMQIVGNDLYLSIKVTDYAPFAQINYLYATVPYGSTSLQSHGHANRYIVDALSGDSILTKNINSEWNEAGSIEFWSILPVHIRLWSDSPVVQAFNTSLNNGSDRSGGADQNTGNWWRPDNDEAHLIYAGSDYTIFDHAVRLISSDLTAPNGDFTLSKVHIRGDYWGSQYQFVDRFGQLYIGTLGGTPSPVFQWNAGVVGFAACGVVVCIDKLNPKRLAWFPYTAVNSNEIARYSEDGGVTWTQMTGNWWGTNGEVTGGSKMQSAGDFGLIDAHPTFYGSEVVPEQGT